jgi:hypothetical protein
MSPLETLFTIVAVLLLAYFALRVLLNYMFPSLTDPAGRAPNHTPDPLDATSHPD